MTSEVYDRNKPITMILGWSQKVFAKIILKRGFTMKNTNHVSF
jgi:hypothetical protein